VYVCVFVVLFMPMMTESCDQLLRPCAGTFTLSEAFVDVYPFVLRSMVFCVLFGCFVYMFCFVLFTCFCFEH